MGAPRRVKELKVVLPTELYFRLLAHKLLRGETIASTVERALHEHFQRAEPSTRPPPEPDEPRL